MLYKYTGWIHKICILVRGISEVQLLWVLVLSSHRTSPIIIFNREMCPAVDWIELKSGMTALLSCLHSQQVMELLCSLMWYLISQLSLVMIVLSSISPWSCVSYSEQVNISATYKQVELLRFTPGRT